MSFSLSFWMIHALSFAVILLPLSKSVILEPSSIDPLCLGNIQVFTCSNVSSALGLFWRFNGSGGPDTFYFNGATPPRPVGLVDTSLVGIRQVNGVNVYTSTAMFNVTEDFDGTQLDCANGLFTRNTTTIKSVNFTTQSSSNLSVMCLEVMSNDTLLVTWFGAECVKEYLVTIIISCEDQIHVPDSQRRFPGSVTSYLYQIPCNGTFTFTVTAFNYFGNVLNSLSKNYSFTRYNYDVMVFSTVDENCTANFHIAIQDEYNITQPQLESCSVSLMSNSSDEVVENCTQARLLNFTVEPGVTYFYTIVINNTVWPNSIRSGNLSVPSCQNFTDDGDETDECTCSSTVVIVVSTVGGIEAILVLIASGWIIIRWIGEKSRGLQGSNSIDVQEFQDGNNQECQGEKNESQAL